ncbi:MAG: Gmad2 immunoglobulin-like domain-containing protein [Acidimicrobiales bacterium]
MAIATTGCRPATEQEVSVKASGAAAAQAQTGFQGIFPFTTREELDAYAAGPDQTYRDPVRTAREFAVSYLGFTTPQLADSGFQAGEPGVGQVPIGVRRDGEFLLATTVNLRQLAQQGAQGPWTVTSSSSPRIQVDSPDPLQRITSPVAVSGRGDAFENTVNVEVREDGTLAGQSRGRGFVTAESRGGPFRGEVAFRAPTRPGGAVIFQDRSAAGVGETNAFATTTVRVLFGSVQLTG